MNFEKLVIYAKSYEYCRDGRINNRVRTPKVESLGYYLSKIEKSNLVLTYELRQARPNFNILIEILKLIVNLSKYIYDNQKELFEDALLRISNEKE